MPAFKEVVDPADLFFATFSVLNVQEEEEDGSQEGTGTRTTHLDALSKAKVRIEPTKQPALKQATVIPWTLAR